LKAKGWQKRSEEFFKNWNGSIENQPKNMKQKRSKAVKKSGLGCHGRSLGSLGDLWAPGCSRNGFWGSPPDILEAF